MDESTLNDLLECSVCLERLNLNSKVLPCQHTFCRKCLEVIVSSQGSLRCPECRVLVEMKIDELPPNVLLMRILEGEFFCSNAHNEKILKYSIDLGMKNASHNQINTVMSSQKELPLLDIQPLNHPNLITNRTLDEQNIIQQTSSSTDISFKKGDHIILRKRIDLNWFVGELSCGRQGVFPINHVQVIVPLPQAQCKALYDFRMGPSEEEGCLTFKKGAIINVFRRVDHNWAEGRIGDVIGIFPIAFVEMNSLAKTLMEIVPQSQFAQSTRTVPPTPHPHIEPISSTESSSTMSSPNSSPSNTSSTSSTTPSSPTNNLLSPLNVATKHENKTNRHSMINVLTPPANSSQRINRHSAEILSVPQAESNLNKSDPKPVASRHSDGSHKSGSSKVTAVIPSLPATYVALYPYKPQKSDELELKKGSIYFVTERCQDGWYKGSNRAHKSGVFPGNYVTPLRSTHREYNQISNLKRQEKQKSSHSSQSSSHKATPPELPPRRNGTVLYGSVWSKPLGNVETFFNRKSDPTTVGGSSQSSSSSKDKKETATSSTAVSLMKRITNMKRSKSPSNNTTAATYSMDNPVFEDISSSPPPGPSSASKRNIHMSHPVHVRSGSCPSQLLHSLPVDVHSSNCAEPTANMFGSQRLKGHKERPSLHGVRSSFEANRLCGLTENVADNERHAQMPATSSNQVAQSQHRKSQSLDAATISSQITANGAKSNKSHHNSTIHKERFRCIVPYPPNSEFELELNVGDIVYVHKKRDNGWFKGSLARTGKMGLFPASFVEPDV
ncbi:hypothetical protein HA402_007316 [Bradysia odoriphaga]|nr:hypothetical protein HA402_007316 [Bradysia odoriphaga]